MKTQFLAFLSFAVVLSVDAATVHKAPLKRLLIDNASVVTDVTGFGSATRLETADGRTWIDAAGNVGQVQRKAVFNGMEAVSGKDPAGGTVAWTFYAEGPEVGYCQLLYNVGRWDLTLERLEDVDVDENGDVRQEMVQRTWSANAPWGSSTVTLNGDWGTETVQLSFVTGIVNRIAFTNDVISNASSDVLKEGDLLALYYPDGSVTSMDQITTNGIEYAVGDDGGAYVKKGDGLTGHVVLPWKVNIEGKEYKVTAIGESAFDGEYHENSFTNLTAPTTVKTIAPYAFYYYDSLTTVSLTSATNIEFEAFSSCSSLTSAKIPSARNIAYRAFYRCTSLTSISLQYAVSIGEGAFYYCSSLTSVHLPSATDILGDTFFECTSLTSISLPSAIRIDYGAFEGCQSLESVKVPSLTSIKPGAFAFCGSLTTVDFGSSPRASVPTLGSVTAFVGVPATCKFVIPLGMYDEWIAAPNWNDLYANGFKFEGFASTEQIKRLPTHETVTNVARSVVNSVWDVSLGVAWEARMHNGHLYYIAVTNRPPEVK